MFVSPFFYVGVTVLAIALSGWLVVSFVGTAYPWVFAWIWFNLFIAVYELYVIWHRHRFSPERCPRDFWNEPVERGFWFKAWQEYTCYSDRRYLDPKDFVFWLEFGNVVFVVLLIVAYMANSALFLGVVLVAQAYHCLLYFLSLYHSKKYTVMHPMKATTYLLISAIWFIIPMVCIRELL